MRAVVRMEIIKKDTPKIGRNSMICGRRRRPAKRRNAALVGERVKLREGARAKSETRLTTFDNCG